MFNKILVPLDGSICSYHALEKAVELQKLCGPDSTMKLICVYRHQGHMESSFSMVRPAAPERMDAALATHTREILQEAKQRALDLGAINLSAHVLAGPTARTIVRFAAEHQADIIVMGGRGHGDIEALLLGSVSHKVTSLAHCPVLIVR